MVMTVASKTEDKLRGEIVSLVQYVRRFREEIAQMVARENDQTHFQSMSEQLDAIIGATETATDSILQSVEDIDQVIEKLRNCEDDAERAALYDRITENTTSAMEACTFQDITGQRVTKIIRSMKFVEERVESLATLWGRDEIDDLAKDINLHKEEPTGDDALLNGPALPEEESISQDDIDKLFD